MIQLSIYQIKNDNTGGIGRSRLLIRDLIEVVRARIINYIIIKFTTLAIELVD